MNFKSKKQYFYMQKKYEEELKQVCPELRHSAGIYFYLRYEEEQKFAYIGKSVDVLNRCISHHLGRKQRIDGSIDKRGYFSEENPLGWQLNVLYFDVGEINEKEQYYIDLYQNAGYELYNIESGGDVGKTLIAERKEPKGYKKGVEYGRRKQLAEIKVFFDKYLDFVIKGKENKIKQRKLKEFANLLDK
jgi:hypothetical protein